LFKEKYCYEDLKSEFPKIEDFIKSSSIDKEVADKIEVKYMAPLLSSREEYRRWFTEIISDIDKYEKFDIYGRIITFVKHDGNEEDYIEPITGAYLYPLPYPLRDLIKIYFHDGLKPQITSFQEFVLNVITLIIKKGIPVQDYVKADIDSKRKYRTSFLIKQLNRQKQKENMENLMDKGIIPKYREMYKIRKGIDQSEVFSSNTVDLDILNDVLLRTFLTALKSAYGGFIKEYFTKVIFLTNPLVKAGRVTVYETNTEADGIGIDVMFKNENDIWATAAITNKIFTNKKCDYTFCFGKEMGEELYKGSWIYVPRREDIEEIDNDIERFSKIAEYKSSSETILYLKKDSIVL
jgi:hypothetical protein